jgi:hypothetical protein
VDAPTITDVAYAFAIAGERSVPRIAAPTGEVPRKLCSGAALPQGKPEMNELTCQDCGARWYSASLRFERTACAGCDGRLSAATRPAAPPPHDGERDARGTAPAPVLATAAAPDA